MNFAPFSFLNAGAAAFNPNNLSDLTFWIDFSDSSFYTLGAGNTLTEIYSKVGGSTTHTLQSFSVSSSIQTYYTRETTPTQPSLYSAKVNSRPTAYRATSWNTSDNNAIIVGPKTDTTSYPDSTEFYVFNRPSYAITTPGYVHARFGGGVDRGVIYNLSTGTPYTDVISYDQNSPAYLYYNTDNTRNFVITRVNNSATATLYNGQIQSDTGAKNDQQDRTKRQFNALGVYYNSATVTSATDTTPAGYQYCEVIVYNRVLSSDERQQVWNYLSNKWNVNLT